MAEMPPVIIQVKAKLDEASLTELREKLRSALPEPTPEQRHALVAAVRGSCACGSCKDYLVELIGSWGQHETSPLPPGEDDSGDAMKERE